MSVKGYWVIAADVSDADAYRAYTAAHPEALTKYGARFIGRGSAADAAEGTARSRMAIIEFPTHAAAVACYHSPEYQRARALRADASRTDIVILAGYEGPQPEDMLKTPKAHSGGEP